MNDNHDLENHELENRVYYSASTNGFYPASMKQIYLDAGSFPEDAKLVDECVYQEFAANLAPAGKMRIAGDDGLPAWADFPPPTQEELTAYAEYEKQKRLQKAASIIAPLQDAIDLDIATEDEIKQLNAWKKYRVLLNRIDLTTAPNIEWPPKPE